MLLFCCINCWDILQFCSIIFLSARWILTMLLQRTREAAFEALRRRRRECAVNLGGTPSSRKANSFRLSRAARFLPPVGEVSAKADRGVFGAKPSLEKDVNFYWGPRASHAQRGASGEVVGNPPAVLVTFAAKSNTPVPRPKPPKNLH